MKNANEHFSEYNSTDSYYKHWLGFVLYRWFESTMRVLSILLVNGYSR
jgi:hypothetical protein